LAYDVLLHYSAPFMMVLLGVILACAGMALRASRFMNWIAFGYLLTGLSLGLQSFMTNQDLAIFAPLANVLYLGGAAATIRGVGLRCGDGWHRKAFVWAIGAVCVLNAARLAYLDDNLVMRILSLNVTLGLIYLSQLPYLIQRWNCLSTLDRLMGFTAVQVALFHFLRAAYVGQEGLQLLDPQAFVANLTQSMHWKVLLACSVVLSLWFGALALTCAVRERFTGSMVRHSA